MSPVTSIPNMQEGNISPAKKLNLGGYSSPKDYSQLGQEDIKGTNLKIPALTLLHGNLRTRQGFVAWARRSTILDTKWSLNFGEI